MIDLGFLKRLIETVEASGIDTLEISRWGTKIRISKTPPNASGNATGVPVNDLRASVPADGRTETSGGEAAAAPAEEAAPEEKAEAEAEEDLFKVTSPMVGTFYRAPAPEAPPYVEVGDHVRKGQTLCILEAMKLMNELESEVDGTIVEIAVENAQPVEYGQLLFRIRPD